MRRCACFIYRIVYYAKQDIAFCVVRALIAPSREGMLLSLPSVLDFSISFPSLLLRPKYLDNVILPCLRRASTSLRLVNTCAVTMPQG
jgi:hypothetical protein